MTAATRAGLGEYVRSSARAGELVVQPRMGMSTPRSGRGRPRDRVRIRPHRRDDHVGQLYAGRRP